MKPVIDILEERISAAMMQVTSQKAPAIVQAAKEAKFGDYQANGVMALAKQLKINPRKLAEQVVEKLALDDLCEKPEIAGPGFINLRLKPQFLSNAIVEINADAKNHLGISKIAQPKKIVVDFSGPNIAKQMHVGHLRSTIIGDCICRLLEFQGHTVIRQNHIGNWGTQFGILIAFQAFKNLPATFEGVTGRNTIQPSIQDLENFYKSAQKLFESNPEFAQLGREYVVRFQKSDPDTIRRWKEIVELSRNEIYPIYKQLNATLKREDERGESEYNEDLPNVVSELKEKGLAVESEGAICVFPEGFKDKDGNPLPVIIQKSDGAYLYATTDLAAIRYRVNELKADEIIYVTDARQQLHFEMVYAVAEMAGWAKKDMLHHVTFGSVLGEDGKPLKTRSGENVKLKDLLDEAIERALKVVDEKSPELSKDEKEKIANAVGIGAVKYADYSNNRTSDYVFSFDKMLAMEGNTAPYMQYAYARIKSIVRKAPEKGVDVNRELKGLKELNLTEPDELALAKHLVRYGEIIESAAADYKPNYLTAYLYELAQKFSSFYQNCPVLVAEPDKRPTRLLLCDLTARTIEHGLHNLLGIEVVEQM